jgi:hypothetical protein
MQQPHANGGPGAIMDARMIALGGGVAELPTKVWTRRMQRRLRRWRRC